MNKSWVFPWNSWGRLVLLVKFLYLVNWLQGVWPCNVTALQLIMWNIQYKYKYLRQVCVYCMCACACASNLLCCAIPSLSPVRHAALPTDSWASALLWLVGECDSALHGLSSLSSPQHPQALWSVLRPSTQIVSLWKTRDESGVITWTFLL